MTVATAFAQGSGDALPGPHDFRPNAGRIGELQPERIDPSTGLLTLSFLHLELPGNAGRPIRFVQSFSSGELGFSRTFGIEGVPQMIFPGHWPTVPQQTLDHGPTFATPDGARHRLATPFGTGPSVSGTRSVMMNDRFWRFDRATQLLSLPNGTFVDFATQRVSSPYGY